METKKSDAVVYIDGYGREHDALVTAVNEREQGFVTLVYVDVNAPEPENVKKLFDIAHVSHESKQEPNPELPSYDVNAWKQRGELHRALPEDHPAFDHPFLPAKVDDAGNVIPIDRPKTQAAVAEHQENALKRMGIEPPAKVDEFSQPAPEPAPSGLNLDRVAAFLESRGYAIKDCHTAGNFLASLKPHEAAGFKQDFDEWCLSHPAPEQSGLPSAADLDRDAEEQRIKDRLTAEFLAKSPEGSMVGIGFRRSDQPLPIPPPATKYTNLNTEKPAEDLVKLGDPLPTEFTDVMAIQEQPAAAPQTSAPVVENKPEGANAAPAEEGQTE